MEIQRINNTNFKCHIGSECRLRNYGKVIQDTGIIRNKKLDIYTAYDKEGNIVHKLYYLSDRFGHWIKSKLKFFENGKCYKTIRSEK